MAKQDLGKKRRCASCGMKFYDFNKTKIACPSCQTAFNPDQLLKDVVCLGAPGMFLEMRWRGVYGGKPFVNYTRSVANEIGANPEDKFCVRSEHGGNGPQYMMSTFSEMIANGTMPQGPVLVGGTEVNGSFDRDCLCLIIITSSSSSSIK